MRTIRPAFLMPLAALYLLAACAPLDSRNRSTDESTLRTQGWLVELGRVEAGDVLETPPSIPSRLRLELEKQLKAAGLLPTAGQAGKRLRLDVETTAVYQGMSTGSGIAGSYGYIALVSRITLTDTADEKVLARTSIRTYNGFGSWTADSTEIYHAEDIVRFVASAELP